METVELIECADCEYTTLAIGADYYLYAMAGRTGLDCRRCGSLHTNVRKVVASRQEVIALSRAFMLSEIDHSSFSEANEAAWLLEQGLKEGLIPQNQIEFFSGWLQQFCEKYELEKPIPSVTNGTRLMLSIMRENKRKGI